jgi:HAD superfamily hydrolase (TIGR01484 family)
MDGTLVAHNGKIHPIDIKILTYPGDPVFIIATGRSLQSVRKTFQANGLFTGKPIPYGMVLLNGALLYIPGEIYYSYNAFDPPVQKQLLNKICKFPEITFLFLDKTSIYMINPTSFGWRSCRQFDFEVVIFTGMASEFQFSKLMCISDQPDLLRKFAHTVSNLEIEGVYSLPTVYEITPKGVNKGNGLMKLMKTMNIKPTMVISSGDGENDLSLFAIADRSYAPSTSPDFIKSKADRVLDWHNTGILKPIMSEIENISTNEEENGDEANLF